MALSKILPASISQPNPVNFIINGDFAVNQRSASTVTSGYFLDRWTITSASATAHLTSSLPDGFSHGLSVSATSGNPIVTQRIEANKVSSLSGKVVTLSFYAKDLGNVGALYASLQYANSTDSFGGTTTISEQTLTSDLPTSWTKYTCSWTVPSGGLNGLALNILCAGSSTFTMGIAGVCLNEGSHAISFPHESYAENLEKCQRYYYKHVHGQSYMMGMGDYYVNTQLDVIVHMPVPMRAIPSLVQTSGANYYLAYGGATSETMSNAWNLWVAHHHAFSLYGTPATNGTAGQARRVITNSTSSMIAMNAEL